MSNYSTFCPFSHFNVLSSMLPPYPAWGVGTLQGTLLPNRGLGLGNVGEQMEHWVSIKTFATVCLSEHQTFLSLLPSFYTWIPFQPSSQGKAGRPSLLASSSKSIICERFLVISKSLSNVNPSVLLPLSAQFLLEIGWLRNTQNPLVCSNSEILLCKYYEVFQSRV